MDIGSILPLLAQRQSGGKSDMSAIIGALTNSQGQAQPTVGNSNSAAQGGLDGLFSGGGANPAALMSLLKGGNGSPNLNLVNLISTLGKQRQAKKLYGLKPVKPFIPDEILGKLVKFFGSFT